MHVHPIKIILIIIFIGARTTKATSFVGNEKCRRKFDTIQHYHRSIILLSRVMLSWREETIS